MTLYSGSDLEDNLTVTCKDRRAYTALRASAAAGFARGTRAFPRQFITQLDAPLQGRISPVGILLEGCRSRHLNSSKIPFENFAAPDASQIVKVVSTRMARLGPCLRISF